MGNNLDEPVWRYIFFRDQYGLLDWNGCCFIDCCLDECGVLEHEVSKARSDWHWWQSVGSLSHPHRTYGTSGAVSSSRYFPEPDRGLLESRCAEERDASRLHEMLCSWQQAATRLEAGEISKEDYDKWRYHYPEFDKAQAYVKVPPQDLF